MSILFDNLQIVQRVGAREPKAVRRAEQKRGATDKAVLKVEPKVKEGAAQQGAEREVTLVVLREAPQGAMQEVEPAAERRVVQKRKSNKVVEWKAAVRRSNRVVPSVVARKAAQGAVWKVEQKANKEEVERRAAVGMSSNGKAEQKVVRRSRREAERRRSKGAGAREKKRGARMKQGAAKRKERTMIERMRRPFSVAMHLVTIAIRHFSLFHAMQNIAMMVCQNIAMNDGGQNMGCVLHFWCISHQKKPF